MLVQACVDKHAASMPQACRKHGQACQKVPNASLRKLAKEVCTCLQQACKISLQFWFGLIANAKIADPDKSAWSDKGLFYL